MGHEGESQAAGTPREGAVEPTSGSNRIGSASRIGVATLGSRVLGMVREHVFARLFGAGGDVFADAFNIAYRIPNLLRDLLAEGALSSAFVPAFAESRQNAGDEAALRLAQIVFTALLIVVGGLALAGTIFAPAVVDVIAPGFGDDPGKRQLTIDLTRCMMPFILLASWAAVCRGILNSHRRYLVPALGPLLFNVVAVAAGYGMWAAGLEAQQAIFGWALAALAGGAATLLVQVPSLWRLGLRLRLVLDFSHPGFRRILRLMGPAVIGLAAVQANVIVNSAIASYLESGAVSWLNYSFRLVYLPIGVVGVAVATVSMVQLSEHAARQDIGAFRHDLIGALRLVAFLSVPASAGLIVLDVPITRLVYEYGKFSSEDTVRSAGALTCYAWALFFYGGVKIVAPGLYALNLLRIPLLASLLAVAVNTIWSLATYQTLGYRTLAVGAGMAGAVNFAVLALATRRHLSLELGVPRQGLRRLPRSLLWGVRLMLLLVPMVAVTWGLHAGIAGALGTVSPAARASAVFGAVAGAVVVWFGGGLLLGVPEAHDIVRFLRRRRPERPSDPSEPGVDPPADAL